MPRRETLSGRVYLCVCKRDLVTMGLLIVPKGLNLVFVPLSPVLGCRCIHVYDVLAAGSGKPHFSVDPLLILNILVMLLQCK